MSILSLKKEETVLRQQQYFERKIPELLSEYPGARVVSCGYGRFNVGAVKCTNELTALAKGCSYVTGKNGLVLDIGGQDTKIIRHQDGNLTGFFINDKCAAGSGMFLTAILNRINSDFADIDLRGVTEPDIHLSSTCAVFAQSEIVELIANNRTEAEIIQAVIWQIFIKAKALINKVEDGPLLLSGGLTSLPGIASFAEKAVGRKCELSPYSAYFSAIGCAVM